MTTSSHSMVATTQRHPLVDLFISAGLAVDAAQNLRSGDPRSFAYQIAQPLTLGEIDVPDVETHVQMWAKSAQSASNPASGPVVTQLVAHVLACYDAATTLPESDDPAELYRVYLDVFIEYMTPSIEGTRCRRYPEPKSVKHLRAQALGVADAARILGNPGPLSWAKFYAEITKPTEEFDAPALK